MQVVNLNEPTHKAKKNVRFPVTRPIDRPQFLAPTLKFLYKYFYFTSNPALLNLSARQDWGH